MTLTNPTDNQLNAAFAEKVAGWTLCWDEDSGGNRYEEWWNGLEGPLDPIFTTSADAVLPWLGKMDAIVTRSLSENDWRVVVPDGRCNSGPSFPRACVIALLRAHGVEVEFK